MKRVDQIILYLSGELDKEASAELEKEMEADASLRETFREVSDAYDFIGNQLKARDEKAFREQLERVMSEAVPESPTPVRSTRLRTWIWLPAAASLALLAGIFIFRGQQAEAFETYYHPETDPYLQTLKERKRGNQESLVISYVNGDFVTLFTESERVLQSEPGNQVAQLFRILSALELGDDKIALLQPWGQQEVGQEIPEQALAWYRALAYLKTDSKTEAAKLLGELAGMQGPYAGDADKLLKLLTK